MEHRNVRLALVAILVVVFAMGMALPGWAQSSTVTTLTVSSNSVTAGSAVSLTASVASGATPVTTGQVVFCDATASRCQNSAILGSAWMTTQGTATIYKTFGPGTHNILAQFKGANTYLASSSASTVVTVTSTAEPTTTSISYTGVAGDYALTGTVIGTGLPGPTGSISFLDASNGNSSVVTAALGTPAYTSSFASTFAVLPTSSNQIIAMGDFRNIGKLDYVVANVSNSATATIMLGNGDGTFTQGATYSAGDWPAGAVVADFNGDGNLDIAFANSSGNGVTILLGIGDGTFTAAATPPVAYAASIAVADFNGDGIPDLAVANNPGNYQVTILLGNGDGTFKAGPSVAVPQWSVFPEGLLAMDLNGDGKMDLAVTSSDSYTPANYVVTILIGKGDGTFKTGATYPTGASDLSITGGDFNGDGIPDIAIANEGSNSVTILLGKGDGTFTAGNTVSTGQGPYAIVAGDFNNDGILDLATANYLDGTVTLLLGDGTGNFTASTPALNAGSGADGIIAGDFNGDGLLDIVTANHGSTTASVLVQSVTSTATATAANVNIFGSGETHNIYASYGGDSYNAASQSGTVALISAPMATQTINFPNPGAQTFGTPLTLIATTTSGLPVSFAVTSGVGTLNGNVLTFSAVGLITVQATQSGNSTYAAATPVSQTFMVNPVTLAVYATPTPVNLGTLAIGAATGNTTTLSFTVPSGETLGNITAVMKGAPNLDFTIAGGTCTAGLSNTTCTVVVQFLPLAPGIRLGALVFMDQSGNKLLATPLFGIGTGPMIAFESGTISTIAGGNGGGYSGDNGPATSAQLSYPNGVTVDGYLNVYIADSFNNVVRKVTPSGTITTIAGGGSGCSGETDGLGDGCPGTNGSFNYTATVRMDGEGSVIITDYYNNAIHKLTPEGTLQLVAGLGSGCSGQTDSWGDGCLANQINIYQPWGTSSDLLGNVFIGDSGHNIIRKVALDGTVTLWAGTGVAGYSGDGGPATSAQFNFPQNGSIDAQGNLYVADYYNNVIRKITAAGIVTTVAGNNSLGAGYSGDGGPATSAQLNYPQSVMFDAAGDLLIDDTGNNVMRKIAPDGTITTIAGNGSAGYSGDGGPALSAQFNGPWDLDVDSYGNIYIPDVYNDAIRKINVRTPPTLSFANTQVGQTSAAQDVRIINFGNSALSIGSIAVSSGFSLGGADTTCSTTNQVLAPGTSCVLGIEFAPTVSGNIGGSVVLTDGDMNASGSQQTITLNGTNGPASQAITIASTGALNYADSSVIVDASAQTSARAAAQPTAIVGKPSPKSVTPVINPSLVATATSGLPVSLAVTSGPATLNGNTLNISAAGVVTVQATQPGNSVYAPATPVTKSIIVNPAPLMVTANNVSVPYGEPIPALTGTLTGVVRDDGITASYTTTATTGSPAGSYAITPVLSDPNNRLSNYAVSLNKGTLYIGQDVTSTTLQTSATNVMSQSSVTLTAKVTGFDAATAGNVNFLDGSAVLGTSAIDGTGTAVLSTSALAVGTHSLKASYAGTTDYAVSTSPAVSEIVEDFQLSATTGSATVNPGGAAVFTVQFTPVNATNIVGAVNLTLTGLPTGASYTVSPAVVQAGSGATPITVTVNTTNANARSFSLPPIVPIVGPGMFWPLLALTLPGIFLLYRKARFRTLRPTLAMLAVAILMAIGMSACSGGSSQSAQSYTMTLTGASGTLQHSVALNLTVQ